MHPEIIETERLVLDQPCADDASALQAIRNHADVLRYLAPREADPLEKVTGLIESVRAANASRKSLHYAVRGRADSVFVGMAGVWRLDPETGFGEIGYMSDPATWGRGYMTEALAAYFDHLDAAWPLEAVRGMVHLDNAPSIKLLERFGFVRLPSLGTEDEGCVWYERRPIRVPGHE